MTESSYLWATTGTGDGAAAGYGAAALFEIFRMLATGASGQGGGVAPDYSSKLLVSGSVSPVTVAPGAALVYGIPYSSSANVSVAIPTPTAASRIDRIVLRASWSSQTVRITRLAGTEGSATPPPVTQNAGVTWDVPLAQVTVTTAGAISIADERPWLQTVADLGITVAKLASGAVTSAKLADAAVSNAKLADAAVSSAKLASGAVTAAKLAADAVTAAAIAAGAVGTSELADAAATNAKLASMAANTIKGRATSSGAPQDLTPTQVVAIVAAADGAGTGLDADLLDGQHAAAFAPASHSHGTADIADNAITAAKLADASVTAAKLAADAVTAAAIAAGAVGTSELATGAVMSTKLAAGAVDAAAIAGGAVGTSELADGAVTAAKLAADAVNAAAIAAGAVGTSELASGAVTAAKLAADAVTAAAIAAGAVGTSELADAAATNAKLASMAANTIKGRATSSGAPQDLTPTQVVAIVAAADGAGTGLDADLLDGQHAAAFAPASHSHGTADIADNAITAAKLADASVTAAKLAAGAVDTAAIANGAVGSAALVNGAATNAKLADMPANTIKGRTAGTAGDPQDLTPTQVVAIVAAADGAGTGLDADLLDGQHAAAFAAAAHTHGTTGINDLAVTTAKLANDAVTEDKLAADAVTAAAIAAGAVGTSELATGAVTSTKLAAGAVDATAIAGGAVGTSELATGAVTSTKLAAGAVDATAIAGGAVGESELADGAVTAVKLAVGAVDAAAIAAGAVGPGELASGAVTAAKLAADAVTAAAIAAGAVGTSELATGAVTSTKLATGAVNAAAIAAGAVTVLKMADMVEGKVLGRWMGTGSGTPGTLGGGDLINIISNYDGAGSGLDGDLLDGQHATAFAAAAHTHLLAHISDVTDVTADITPGPGATINAKKAVKFGKLVMATVQLSRGENSSGWLCTLPIPAGEWFLFTGTFWNLALTPQFRATPMMINAYGQVVAPDFDSYSGTFGFSVVFLEQ